MDDLFDRRSTRRANCTVAQEILTSSARPSGRTATGVNFAVASTVADAVTVCLFDEAGAEERVRLDDYDAGVWHGFVPGLRPGQAYGYRVEGPWDPAAGLRCNPGKLLLDPYARAFRGEVAFGPEVLGHDLDDPDKPSRLDSAGFVPRCLVVGSGIRLGRRCAPAPPVRGHGALRGARQGLHHAPPGHPADAARAPTRGWPTRRPSPTCRTWA